jgi:hypothetical protein
MSRARRCDFLIMCETRFSPSPGGGVLILPGDETGAVLANGARAEFSTV